MKRIGQMEFGFSIEKRDILARQREARRPWWVVPRPTGNPGIEALAARVETLHNENCARLRRLEEYDF